MCPRAYLKGGVVQPLPPPRNFRIFFKSEGKEGERKRKWKGMGGGVIVNIFFEVELG